MDKRALTDSIRTAAGVLLAVLALSACTQTSDWIRGKPRSAASPADTNFDSETAAYIDELGRIASGDPAAQAEIYADAEAAAQLTPDVSTQLRLGLVLAIPGHPESDPARAQSILREVLAQTVLLTPGEISLATILLNNVERQIVTESEARRQQASNTRQVQSRERLMREQLDALESENQQLRNDLDEAEQKLGAITSIERSIREQE